MEYQHVVAKLEAPLSRITLNRPERRNALGLDVMQEVISALRAVP